MRGLRQQKRLYRVEVWFRVFRFYFGRFLFAQLKVLAHELGHAFKEMLQEDAVR